ncbi:hypothetical protein GCM10022381_02380 [Leifsonia kafniensis]|uniref:Uncharacterized protein n=1 Tax=Leifsonia kafniensis TaxID=475957 RepID=A0ABP7K317_9MICO
MARFENAHNVTGVDHALPIDIHSDPLVHPFDSRGSGIVPDRFLARTGSDPTMLQTVGIHGSRLVRAAVSCLTPMRFGCPVQLSWTG